MPENKPEEAQDLPAKAPLMKHTGWLEQQQAASLISSVIVSPAPHRSVVHCVRRSSARPAARSEIFTTKASR
jgi:hypothetical protein